ncbi:MAG: cysteine hydrolase [Acidimicrobiia bacterium]|nr:cysteine hydrolase [Acidimicrobiia bacterium]
MAVDLTPHLAATHTALVVFECQEGIVGPDGVLPDLAAAVRDGDVLAHIGEMAAAARESGVPVFHCMFERCEASTMNTPLELRMRAGAHSPPSIGPIVAALTPIDEDIIVTRSDGLTGFHGTDLDNRLRTAGVATIVLTGVSINVGILGTAIEAVNHGYTVIVPTDCVAGDPPEYAEQSLRYSLRNLAFLSTSAEIAQVWHR